MEMSELQTHAETARKLLKNPEWLPTRLLWARLTEHLEAAITAYLSAIVTAPVTVQGGETGELAERLQARTVTRTRQHMDHFGIGAAGSTTYYEPDPDCLEAARRLTALQSALDAAEREREFRKYITELHSAEADRLVARAEAAEAERDALKSKLAEAVEVLRPFAAYSEDTDPGDWASDDGEIAECYAGGLRVAIKLRDLRAARSLLSGSGEAPKGDHHA